MSKIIELELRLEWGKVLAISEDRHASGPLELPSNVGDLEQEVRTIREVLRRKGLPPGAAPPHLPGELAAQAPTGDAYTEAARALGEALFRGLLPEGKGPERLYRERLHQAQGENARLRLILAFALEGDDASGVAPLAALPWEYLCDPEVGHLAISPHLLLARRYHLNQPASPLALKHPLEVLVALAQPWDQDQYIREESRRHLEDGLRRLQVPRVHLELEPQPTLSRILERLKEGSFQVLHFIGHGTFAEGQGGLLCFEDEYGATHKVTAPELRQHLGRLRLVLLTACASAQTSPQDPFAGVAQALVAGGVPAVVAFRETVLVMAANAFVERLYSALGQGMALDEAVAAARTQLSASSEPLVRGEWSLPVLYLQGEPRAATRPRAKGAPAPVLSEPPLPPGNLDFAQLVRPAHFLGRGQEMIALNRALRKPLAPKRFVTLRGAGGMGKSVLALECAHWHREERYFREGIYWFSARERSAELLLGEVAASLGLDWERLPEAQRTVLLALTVARREVLLVVDNADDLREDPAFREFLKGLSPTGRGRVLLTSRRPMSIDGEHLEPAENLRPLGMDAGVALFLAHWQPGEVTPEQVVEVEAICGPTLLAGHPMAIEIAAGVAKREHMHDLSSLRRRLEQRFTETLRLRVTDREERSLAASLGLSYDILSPEAKALLPRLAVYRHPFNEGAAQAVAGDLAGWGEALVELVEAPLLDRVTVILQRPSAPRKTEDRYLFHPVLREWAYDMLGEPTPVHAAAGRYLVSTRKLLDHLEGIHHLERAGEQRALLEAVRAVVNQLHREGYWGVARWALELALGSALALGDRGEEGRARGELGGNAWRRGDLPRAIQHHRAALAIAQEIGDKRMEGAVLGNLGLCYRQQGDLPRAIQHHQAALAISRAIGHKQAEGNSLGNLGICYFQQGDLPRAIEHLQQALAISREIGDRQGEGNHLGDLGLCYRRQGDLPRAIQHHRAALAIAQEIGDKQGEGNALGSLGLCYRRQGDLPRAIQHHQAALAIAREIGDKEGEGNHLGNLGNCYWELFNQEKDEEKRMELFLTGAALLLASAQVFQGMGVPLPPGTASGLEALRKPGDEAFARLEEALAPHLEEMVEKEVEAGQEAYAQLQKEPPPRQPLVQPSSPGSWEAGAAFMQRLVAENRRLFEELGKL